MQKTRPKRSIRWKVIITMTTVFVCMFVVLFSIYYTSMQNILSEREKDNITNQAALSENVLMSSVSFLPNVTRDWSSWDYTYDYIQGDYDAFLDDYLTEYPFQLYRLDFLTIINAEGGIVYEGFYDHTSDAFTGEHPDLATLYEKVLPLTLNSFQDGASLDLWDTTQIGAPGFVSHEGGIYYLSSYPIIHSDETGPATGAFIFGRVIDTDEIDFITGNEGMDFTILPLEQLNISEEQAQELKDTGTVVVADDNTATVYLTFPDLFGNESLVVSQSSPRTLYIQGRSVVMVNLAIIALSCAVAMALIIQRIGRIIVKPLGTLSGEVTKINLDTVDSFVPVDDNTTELAELGHSFNNMLTHIREDRENLYYHANFDTLTGLRNRNNINDTLTKMLLDSSEDRQHITVFCFDIDRFKFINDTLGPAMGDNFLLEVTKRLSSHIGSSAVLGRMGGDDFVAIVKGLETEVERQLFVARITDIFREPFEVKERKLSITLSIGSSSYPQDGQDASTLFGNAEIAIYRAKELGKGLYVSYQRQFQADLQRKVYIENQLRNVINDGCKEFQAFLQPKVCTQTGEIHACEGLIRWLAPEGTIGPMEFIPQAEESGLIIPISWWMIAECCRINKQLENAGIIMQISINIPAQVLLHDEFIDKVQGAAQQSGIPTERIDIEITESTLLNDISGVNDVLKRLHALGCEVSVDDFGTGYSSLSYLNRLSVDRIKIDRSFIQGLDEGEENKEIVKAIIALAKSMNMVLTAEGVENIEQSRFLKDLYCDELQGFFFSKPVPLDEFTDFYRSWEEDKIIPFLRKLD
ncbi:EAL domain-containing protein [Christensenellaceae bacterium OttesenSCG-928-K19]|nr:EAL domain-containing protein [Christensenellaceae bacterium OttesenSCG-928-K19]